MLFRCIVCFWSGDPYRALPGGGMMGVCLSVCGWVDMRIWVHVLAYIWDFYKYLLIPITALPVPINKEIEYYGVGYRYRGREQKAKQKHADQTLCDIERVCCYIRSVAHSHLFFDLRVCGVVSVDGLRVMLRHNWIYLSQLSTSFKYPCLRWNDNKIYPSRRERRGKVLWRKKTF